MARPLSARAHEQVLDVALRLFAERGIDGASMDAIAESSGVSKATIYNHWKDKDALCLEVMARLYGADEEFPVSVTDDIRKGIAAVLGRRPSEECSNMQTRLLPHLMAYATRNNAFGIAWRSRAMERPRKHLTKLLKRAVELGQLPADLDHDMAVALLLGPMMYAKFMSLGGHKTPEDLPDRVAEAFWKAHAVKKRLGEKKRR
ncbi:MAG TPA: TetR/AcrR family transcriptional regulator [Blastocatellia bacterium]|jgi:AcrR family transcriptional regulator|nr:TetR/AcrR family transcriptional regulator [Blastocatellia bacterium]